MAQICWLATLEIASFPGAEGEERAPGNKATLESDAEIINVPLP